MYMVDFFITSLIGVVGFLMDSFFMSCGIVLKIFSFIDIVDNVQSLLTKVMTGLIID